MLETFGGGLTTDMSKKHHHKSPPTSNSSFGGWKGGDSRPDLHVPGIPLDRNVDGSAHLNINVSETIPTRRSSSDVGRIGHSGSAVNNGGESGSSVTHNVCVTSSGGNAAGSSGQSSLHSSANSIAENGEADTAFQGFVSGLEISCHKQGLGGGIGNAVDTSHSSYKRTGSAPQISDYMFNWSQSKLNDGNRVISENAVEGMASSMTGNDSSEVGCATSESIHPADYYDYDCGGPQNISHYSSGHGNSHSSMTSQQLEPAREIGHTTTGVPSYVPEQPLSTLGGVAPGSGSGSVFPVQHGSPPPHVGLENIYGGGDQDIQGAGDEHASPRFAASHSNSKHHSAERHHKRATTLMSGAPLEYPLTYHPGSVPSPPVSQNFLTDILPGEFPSDGKEREAYVVGQHSVSKSMDSQAFSRQMQRQPAPSTGSFGSYKDRAALQHPSSHGILECLTNDESPTTGRPRYSSTSSHLNREVYDKTLIPPRSGSYDAPGSASGRGGGGAHQGKQEVMDLSSAFGGLAVSKPAKSNPNLQKLHSFHSRRTAAHEYLDYEAAPVSFKPSPYVEYNPPEYMADLRNHAQSARRLDMDARMIDQAGLEVAEPQVVQPANTYYVDPRGPGMYPLDHFQYRPVASPQYAESSLYSQDVDHRRAMGHSPPALHVAYYPTDIRPTVSAPPRDPVNHRRACSPVDDLRYETRQGGGGARQKPFKERRDREGRDRPRDKPRVGVPVNSAGLTGRHSLLESFLSHGNGKGRRWELSDIHGQVVQFCRDQHGSRFIQQKLEVSSDEEKERFFEEILPHVPNLITDVFGNYVIQKLFDHGTLSQQEGLASFLIGHAVHLSLQMYGCRVVQKALTFASLDTLIALVQEFQGHVMRCVQDQNGNHVIQKCIEVVSRTADEQGSHLHIQFIIDAFAGEVQKLSTHAYGCRVIQRILEHCVDSQRDTILKEIRVCFSGLIGDQYGNYVIQHVLKHGKPKDRNVLMEEVQTNLLAYSQHKFASNVVEKCLQFGTLKERAYIIDHVFTANSPGIRDGQKNLLHTMVCDPYANYVVQKMLDVATTEQHNAIMAEIKAHSTQLKRFTFGKYIISRLEKLPDNEKA